MVRVDPMPIKFCLASDFNDMFKLSDSQHIKIIKYLLWAELCTFAGRKYQ